MLVAIVFCEKLRITKTQCIYRPNYNNGINLRYVGPREEGRFDLNGDSY
jgi:hypothetical protein